MAGFGENCVMEHEVVLVAEGVATENNKVEGAT